MVTNSEIFHLLSLSEFYYSFHKAGTGSYLMFVNPVHPQPPFSLRSILLFFPLLASLLVGVMIWSVKWSTFVIHFCVCHQKATSKKWLSINFNFHSCYINIYIGYSESKYRLRISLTHPRDCHFAHVQWLPLSIEKPQTPFREIRVMFMFVPVLQTCLRQLKGPPTVKYGL